MLAALEMVHQEQYMARAANALPISRLLAGAELPPDEGDALSDEERNASDEQLDGGGRSLLLIPASLEV